MGSSSDILPGAEELAEHSSAMRRLARRLLYDAGRADDVVQQAWIAALTQSRPRGVSLRQWLGGVVRNLARQSKREDARRLRREQAAARPEAQVSFTHKVDGAMDRVEIMRRLVEAVDTLEEPYRETIAMRFFEDLAPREIAKRRGVPIDTVQTHLRRGLQRLRRHLNPSHSPASPTASSGGFARDAFLSALVPLAGPLPLSIKFGAALGISSTLSKWGILSMGTKTAVAVTSAIAVAIAVVVLRFDFDSAAPVQEQPEAASAISTTQTPVNTSLANRSTVDPLDQYDGQQRTATFLNVDQDATQWLVSGTVQSAIGGTPMQATVAVEILKISGETETHLAQAETLSDAKGQFSLKLDAAGTNAFLRAQAKAEGFFSFQKVQPLLQETQPKSLELVLYPLNTTVKGHVIDSTTRQPIAEARVWTYKEQSYTDEEGNYRFLTPAQVSLGQLYARAPGYTHKRAIVEELVAGADVTINFELAPELRIAGRVTDESGNIVVGATVSTFYSFDNEVQTDTQGRFNLGHLDPGRPEHMLRTRKPGFVSGALTIATAGQLIIDQDVTLERGARVTGVLNDELGIPQPNVGLYIGFSPYDSSRIDAKTDASGRFAFEAVSKGEQTMVVESAGFAPLRELFTVPEGISALPPMTLVLSKGHFIAGYVRDTAGKPVPRISVSIQYHGEDVGEGGQTSEQGHFRIDDLPADNLELATYSKGFVSKRHPILEVDRDDLEFVVQRSAKIAGIVLDGPTGEPLDNFLIRFAEPELQPGEQRASGYRAIWVREGMAFSNAGGQWDTGDTNLAPGCVIGIEVSAPGYAPTVARRAIASAEPDPSQLELRLYPGASVEGKIVARSSSEAIPNATVKLFSKQTPLRATDSDDTHGRLQTRTNMDGRFELHNVPTGKQSLFVEHPDWAVVVDGPFEVRVGSSPAPRWIELSPGAKVSGRIESIDGEPVVDATIRLQPRSGPASSGRTQDLETRSDSMGQFAFENVPLGDFWAQRVLHGGDHQVSSIYAGVSVADSSPQMVTLRPAGSATIRGHLQTSEDLPAHVPVKLVRIDSAGQVQDPFDRNPSAYLAGFAHNGEFEITGVAAGDYQVTASHFAWKSATRYHGQTTVKVGPASAKSISLDLEVTSKR